VQQVKGHIVVVAPGPSANLPQSSRMLKVTVLPEEPPYSALVEQKYDAYVTLAPDGSYQIKTLRNDTFKNMVSALLVDPNADVSTGKSERGVGVDILGFMMMFMLMIAFYNLNGFAEDKEHGQLRRIAAAPVSFGQYLAAHCVYSFSLMLPEYLLLLLLKFCGWKIGFSLPQYAGLMVVLGFFGISLAMLLHTLIEKPDNANMLGNSFMVLTSILAGGFYEFSKNNIVLDTLVGLLPQKKLLDFAQYLEKGNAWQHSGTILYVAAFSLILFVASWMFLQHMYVKKI